MKIYTILSTVCILFISMSLSAQVDNTPSPTLSQATVQEEIFKVVEEMPQFPGCEELQISKKEKRTCASKKMMEYIMANLVYPEEAKQKGIEGTAVVQFIVDKTGGIKNITILKDLGEECAISCGQSAKNMLEKMGKEVTWVPGKQRGKAVSVQYTLPLQFKL